MKFTSYAVAALLLTNGCLATATTLRGLQNDEDAGTPGNDRRHRVLTRGANGVPSFLQGDFGELRGVGQGGVDGSAVQESARDIVQGLVGGLGASGNERLVPGKVNRSKDNSVHVRFQQEINGMPVEGAAIMLHADADGNVFAVNGEFVSGLKVPTTPALGAEEALSAALEESVIPNDASRQGVKLTMVRGLKDGRAHLAWKATYEYEKSNEFGLVPQKDELFASAETGEEVARFPRIYGARDLETRDCGTQTQNCPIVSTSANPISTGDPAIDSAHNYAIATYDYYFNNHGRDSIDDAGMTLISRVHYSQNYNNAFWDGTQSTYEHRDRTVQSALF